MHINCTLKATNRNMFSLAVKCIWYQYLIVQNQKKNVMKTPAKSASTHKMDLTVNWLHLSFGMCRCFIKWFIVNLPSPPIYIGMIELIEHPDLWPQTRKMKFTQKRRLDKLCLFNGYRRFRYPETNLLGESFTVEIVYHKMLTLEISLKLFWQI